MNFLSSTRENEILNSCCGLGFLRPPHTIVRLQQAHVSVRKLGQLEHNALDWGQSLSFPHNPSNLEVRAAKLQAKTGYILHIWYMMVEHSYNNIAVDHIQCYYKYAPPWSHARRTPSLPSTDHNVRPQISVYNHFRRHFTPTIIIHCLRMRAHEWAKKEFTNYPNTGPYQKFWISQYSNSDSDKSKLPPHIYEKGLQ